MKKPYPRTSDIRQAIVETINTNPLVRPIDFCDEVREVLEEKGFCTYLLTAKRIWRVYEEMVKKGIIYDYLEVVKKDRRV
ncbi:MAG: hypothetical protein DRJ43_02640 [Thermoprotei archaeon]|nr:MAG: hypothetical protein DRJ43_02640 [Thermoprotei archaeon]